MLTTGFLEARYLSPVSGLLTALQNQWRKSVIGTTTATLTIACPAVQGSRTQGLALTSLYATGSGGTLTIADGAGTEISYLLTATPLQLTWPLGLTIERASDLTVAIAGAAAGASISVTGIVLS